MPTVYWVGSLPCLIAMLGLAGCCARCGAARSDVEQALVAAALVLSPMTVTGCLRCGAPPMILPRSTSSTTTCPSAYWWFFTRRIFDPQAALDLTGETAAVAFERRRSFRGTTIGEQEGWIFAIARSHLSHFWRRGSVERDALSRLGVDVPMIVADEELERIEELAGTHEMRSRIAVELKRLPLDQQRAVAAHIVEEHSYAELSYK